MFDWSEKSKEQYYRKAEKLVKEAGFNDLLKVDRTKIAVNPERVKVYFKSFTRKGNTRRWWSAKKAIEGLAEMPPIKGSCGVVCKSIYLHVYIEIPIEGRRNENEICNAK